MSDPISVGPWDDYAATTAFPPTAPSPTTPPWEDFSQAQNPPSAPTGTGMFDQTLKPGTTSPATAFQQDVQGPGIQDTTVGDVGTVAGIGGLAKAGFEGAALATKGAMSLLESPESLKSAGITAQALEHMAPGGQNPADYVSAVEKQLQKNGALGKTAKETWDKMSPLATQAGQAVSQAKQAIAQAAPDALMVDAKSALDPIANEALKRGTGLFSKTESLANPFYDAFDGLQKIAQQQGGKLSIDNLDAALQEAGQFMNEGGEAIRTTFSKLYGKLADVRDTIVNNVAEQSGDQILKSNLLENNANYSTYMRLLPSVEKSAYKEAVKEGVSAYQKYGGPIITKVAAGAEFAHLLHESVNKLLGSD